MHDIAQKQIFFFKTTRAGSGSGFGGELSGSGSGKKVRIRQKGPDPDSDPQHCLRQLYHVPVHLINKTNLIRRDSLRVYSDQIKYGLFFNQHKVVVHILNKVSYT
jgi:hypothetical protein